MGNRHMTEGDTMDSQPTLNLTKDMAVVLVTRDITEDLHGRLFAGIIKPRIAEGCKNVVLLIDSDGGEGEFGIRTYYALKEIKASGVNLKTYNLRSAHSAALMVFCAGTERWCSDEATFLMHEARYIFAKTEAVDALYLEQALCDVRLRSNQMAEILTQTTTWTKEEVLDRLRHEGTKLDAQGAEKCSLVTQRGKYELNDCDLLIP
jgi:ATP-dependent protease ClpP protease subunit